MKHWSEFEGEVKGHSQGRGPSCSVGRLLESLPPEAGEIVRRVLGDRNLSAPAVHRALRDRVGESAPSIWSIGHHRRENCRCTR